MVLDAVASFPLAVLPDLTELHAVGSAEYLRCDASGFPYAVSCVVPVGAAGADLHAEFPGDTSETFRYLVLITLGYGEQFGHEVI